MLNREWYADDRQRQAESEANVFEEDPYAGKNDPEDVSDNSENARGAVPLYVFAEGKSTQPGNFETLQSERNAYDGDTKQHTHYRVAQEDEKSST